MRRRFPDPLNKRGATSYNRHSVFSVHFVSMQIFISDTVKKSATRFVAPGRLCSAHSQEQRVQMTALPQLFLTQR